MPASLFAMELSRSIPWALLIMATYVVGSGCNVKSGPATGVVQGQVTYQGKPVTSGDITFYSGELGSGISEALDVDGKYVTQTPLRIGSYVVTILPPSDPPPEDPTKMVVKVVSKDIPAKFRDPSKSGLKIDLREGVNTFDIEMSE